MRKREAKIYNRLKQEGKIPDPSIPLKNSRHEKLVQLTFANLSKLGGFIGQKKQIAIEAGYGARFANAQYSDIFNRPAVKARLRYLQDTAVSKLVLGRTEALEILTEQARATMGDYVIEDDGPAGVLTLRPIFKKGQKAPNPHAIKSVEKHYDGLGRMVLKVSLHSSKDAIELIGKFRGWEQPKKIEVEAKFAKDLSDEDLALIAAGKTSAGTSLDEDGD